MRSGAHPHIAPGARPRALVVALAVLTAATVLAIASPHLGEHASPPAEQGGSLRAPGLAILTAGGGRISGPDIHDHEHPEVETADDAGADGHSSVGGGENDPITAPVAAGAFTAPANTAFRLHFTPGVDADTRRVVTAAAGIWSTALVVRVPIEVHVGTEAMSPGQLGAAGPTTAYWGRATFPRPDVLYPVALANQFAGTDLDPSSPDIDLVLSTAIAWDKATDGTVTPTGQSMLSVAIHELGHGLGLTSWVRPSGLGWTVNYLVGGTTAALAYDRLVSTTTGTPITSVLDSLLGTLIASPLQWTGTHARSANGGTPPRLYSPTAFQPGSSVGHLDEATYRSHVMTPFLGRGEVHTSIDALTRGFLTDIGWTTVAPTPTPTPTTAPIAPTSGAAPTNAGRTESFVRAVTTDFLGRDATAGERTTWRDRLLAGTSRDVVTRAFAFSDEWVGVIVDGLYRSTLGRGPDPAGRSHWVQVIRSGRTPAEVAAWFYASDEYYRRSGNTASSWITDLYTEILGRSPDQGGLWFWVSQTGVRSRADIAYDFYQSLESRRDRVDTLFRRLLGRGPDAGGWAYWSGVLANGRDVDLAVFLAASEEYHQRSWTRFGAAATAG